MIDRVFASYGTFFHGVVTHSQRMITSVVLWSLRKAIFFSFKEMPRSVVNQRREQLINNYNAKPLSCSAKDHEIEVVYVPSVAEIKTGNILLLCLNYPLQKHDPKKYEPLLHAGADIVLWNPSKPTACSYSDDLECVIKRIQEIYPEKVMALHAHCAATDPTISAVARLKDNKKVHLILDRGHGNIQALAESFTFFSKLPLIKSVLQKEFDCRGRENIAEIGGDILFMQTKGIDQIFDYGHHQNLSRDLRALRPDGEVIEMEEEDHWSEWSEKTYHQVLSFLEKRNIVSLNNPSITKENLLPTLKAGSFTTKAIHWVKKLAFYSGKP